MEQRRMNPAFDLAVEYEVGEILEALVMKWRSADIFAF
jgi:hypothetical protein